jgi:hypothetical protein
VYKVVRLQKGNWFETGGPDDTINMASISMTTPVSQFLQEWPFFPPAAGGEEDERRLKLAEYGKYLESQDFDAPSAIDDYRQLSEFLSDYPKIDPIYADRMYTAFKEIVAMDRQSGKFYDWV